MPGRWGRRPRTRVDFRAADAGGPAAFERRLKRERAAAVAVVRTIREMVAAGKAVSPPAAEWVTVGVAELLSEAFREVADRSRIQARALAECALEVASRLDESYPPEERALALTIAWMDLATADLRDGAARAALKCLDEAEEALRAQPDPDPQRAAIHISRASVLHAVGRDREARICVERARVAFEELGNPGGIAECRMILAMIDGRDNTKP